MCRAPKPDIYIKNNKLLAIFMSRSIDATDEPDERLGKLVNHSRLHANCQKKVIVVDGKPRIGLFAAKPIAVGDEIQFDYGDRSRKSTTAFPWLLKWQTIDQVVSQLKAIYDFVFVIYFLH